MVGDGEDAARRRQQVEAERLGGVIRRNIGFSLVYNVAASSLALAGMVGPLLAAVLMPVSSLTVVVSSALSNTFARPSPRTSGPRSRAEA